MQGNAISTTEQTEAKQYKLAAFDAYLTFCALGGLITDDDGHITQLKLADFCSQVGVNEATTWRWKKEPGFAMKVRARRDEIIPLARETKAFNQLYLLGMQMQDKRAAVDALKTYLGHHSNLRLPTVKQEVKIEGNFLDMMTAATQEGIIEGEIVDANIVEPQTDTRGSDQDSGVLPSTS
jgi:hypothetical protein